MVAGSVVLSLWGPGVMAPAAMGTQDRADPGLDQVLPL